MRYQLWWGISTPDLDKRYEDCVKSILEDDLKEEMSYNMERAVELAKEDAIRGGIHSLPFIEVMAELP